MKLLAVFEQSNKAEKLVALASIEVTSEVSEIICH